MSPLIGLVLSVLLSSCVASSQNTSSHPSRTNRKLFLIWTHENTVGRTRLSSTSYVLPPTTNCGCQVTTDRASLRDADTIIFNLNDFDPEDVPLYRAASQRWLLFNIDPQPRRHYDRVDEILFNLTATNGPHSDLQIVNSFIFQPQHSVRTTEAPPLRKEEREEDDDEEREEVIYTDERKIPIVWLNSCEHNDDDYRTKFVQQLNASIHVDTIGIYNEVACYAQTVPELIETLGTQYYFIVMFERQLCAHPILTDLWFVLNTTSIVPVVFSGNVANYSAFMPPNSFVDATNFRPKELASKLNAILFNQEQYKQMFAWREKWRPEGDARPLEPSEQLYCALCHPEGGKNRFSSKSLRAIQEELFDSGECLDKRQLERLVRLNYKVL